MAQEKRMRYFDPPIRSMKQALGDIKGAKGEEIVEPIRERSRKMARNALKRMKRGTRR